MQKDFICFNTVLLKYLNFDVSYFDACKEIANTIVSSDQTDGTYMTSKDVNRIIKKISSKYKLSSIPKNADIMRLLPANNYYKNILKIKPVKTSSGVAIITIMPMPFECPHGKCIYCPGGIEVNTPLSYVGSEPSTKLAQKVDYDPFLQVQNKVIQLIERGHNVEKAELVIVGGTFPFYPIDYQLKFVTLCYQALNSFVFDKNNSEIKFNYLEGRKKYLVNDLFDNSNESNKIKCRQQTELLEKSKNDNELADIRCVGLTIETKPDYCKQEHIDRMLSFGTTRIELGVQSLSDSVFRKVNRGHTLFDVYEAFYIARNCGYKIAAHMMPGLPGSNYSKDVMDSKTLFEDPRLKPDMIKIYPTVVLKNTGLYKLYENKKYEAYSTEDLVRLLVEIKKLIPPWVRIMRIQREIHPDDVISGPKMGNLRQLVAGELKKQNVRCKCIRCREVGLLENNRILNPNDAILFKEEYFASRGKELFLSFETKDKSALFGFLRLRLLSFPQRKELQEHLDKPCNQNVDYFGDEDHCTYQSAIVRELHVYGPLVGLKMNLDGINKNENFNSLKKVKIKDSLGKFPFQHIGFGQKLLLEAENICKNEYNIKKLSVISAVGTRNYYRKFGYTNNGPYVTKIL